MSISLSLLVAMLGLLAHAATGYKVPPKEILDVMRAPPPPRPLLSPTRDKLLLVGFHEHPSIERIAQPYLKLAGIRLEPRNRARHDTPGGYGIPPCVRSLDVVDVGRAKTRAIPIVKLRCAQPPAWSADGRKFALIDNADRSVDLYVGDVASARLTKIANATLNPMFGHHLHWMPDRKTLLVKLVPRAGARPKPKETTTPRGPVIQEANGEKGEFSTYEKRDTLNTKNDEDLFEYYGESQIALIDVLSGKITPVGQPGLHVEVHSSPDAKHLLVQTITKPFSYSVAYSRFPRRIDVWTLGDARAPRTHEIAKIPLADRVPVHGVRSGPREFEWHPAKPATLVWAEALDGGDWNQKVPARDKVMRRDAPFTSPPSEVTRVEQRYGGWDWLDDHEGLLSQYDENRHWKKMFLVDIEDQRKTPRLVYDLSSDEQYLDPGNPVYVTRADGTSVVRRDGRKMYMSGIGASPEGDRPFLDELDLESMKSTRLWRSGRTDFEQFLNFDGADAQTFSTWHQSPTDPPNAWLRKLGGSATAPPAEAQYSSTRTAITHLPDPTPQLRDIKKRLVKYKRADGVELSFVLYTPPGWREGTRVPTILYAYPLDFADAAKAGQVSGSQMTFTRLNQYRLLLLAGYAIIDRAAFPIVGDPKKAYDTYLEQLTANAKAAVDEAVRLGVADPNRLGVTGHSHGALMTANLVLHTNLFKAGVATSGAYNKVLTPFGFQNERRSLWQAPEVYRKVSPFFAVDKLKTPLLLIHGDSDANPGTTPMQATFLFDAIRGTGGVARLVMLPFEPHWYAARESNEQLIAEMVTWFDKYLKR